MPVSRIISPVDGKSEILQNGFGTNLHIRLLDGTFTPTEAMSTLADISAHECTHPQYAPVNITVTYDKASNVVRVIPTDAEFNSGNPTTISAKYAVVMKGTVAAATSASKILMWCDGNVAQLTNASASAANPSIITSNSHGVTAAQTLCVAECASNRDIVGRIYPAASITTNTFALTGLDLSAAGGATSLSLIKLADTSEAAAAADVVRFVANRLLRW